MYPAGFKSFCRRQPKRGTRIDRRGTCAGIDRVVTSLTDLTGVPAGSPPEEVLCRYGSLTHPFQP